MRTITHFLARKGVASTSAAFAVPTPAKPGSPAAEQPSEPTLADIGARVGEKNETLRNLLIDTDRRIGALDDLKEAFRNLVEPIGSGLQSLEQEKSDKVALRTALGGLRAGKESVRSEFSALKKRAGELEARARSWAANWRWRSRPCAVSRVTKPSLPAKSWPCVQRSPISRANWRRRPPMAGP